VFSVMLAGGGIKGGEIYGASNATASEPEFDAVGPEDLATTVYHQLGIVADKELMAPGGRPIEIVDGGKVISAPSLPGLFCCKRSRAEPGPDLAQRCAARHGSRNDLPWSAARRC
jgi:hypothetical protein